MCARQLALFSLIFAAASVWAQSPETTLVVYLGEGADQPAGPVEQMKHELAPLMRSAGYDVEWRNLRGGSREVQSASALIVVELNGTCAPARLQDPIQNSTSLAVTSVADGRVLPFSTVDCTALSRSLSSALSGEVGARRTFLYGRAMARVVAHEFYHVLTGTIDHAVAGVARRCFSVNDLLSERFEFEATTLARLRPEPPHLAAVLEEGSR